MWIIIRNESVFVKKNFHIALRQAQARRPDTAKKNA